MARVARCGTVPHRGLEGAHRSLVLFACAPADSGPGNPGTEADGRRFCGELALRSCAEVIATRDPQYYNTVEAHFRGGRTAPAPSTSALGKARSYNMANPVSV